MDVDVHSNFRIYLVTRYSNPNYIPDVYNKLCVIQFTANFEDITEQLLTVAVKIIQPDLQKRRDIINLKLTDLDQQIKNSENIILKLLAQAKTQSFLENDDYICIL